MYNILLDIFTNAVLQYMKQLGSVYTRGHRVRDRKGEDITEFPDDLHIREFPSILLTNDTGVPSMNKREQHVTV